MWKERGAGAVGGNGACARWMVKAIGVGHTSWFVHWWQGVVAYPEHGLAHGGLGDPTWGPRRFVDGAVLVVTFSTRDLSLRVAMALGTVKD